MWFFLATSAAFQDISSLVLLRFLIYPILQLLASYDWPTDQTSNQPTNQPTTNQPLYWVIHLTQPHAIYSNPIQINPSTHTSFRPSLHSSVRPSLPNSTNLRSSIGSLSHNNLALGKLLIRAFCVNWVLITELETACHWSVFSTTYEGCSIIYLPKQERRQWADWNKSVDVGTCLEVSHMQTQLSEILTVRVTECQVNLCVRFLRNCSIWSKDQL